MEHVGVGRRACKGSTEANALGIWPPENNADIEAPRDHPVEHIEEGSVAVRHPEIRRVKGDCKPNTTLRFVDRLADTPKS
jgi:uncharacterized protein YjlB